MKGLVFRRFAKSAWRSLANFEPEQGNAQGFGWCLTLWCDAVASKRLSEISVREVEQSEAVHSWIRKSCEPQAFEIGARLSLFNKTKSR